MQGPMGHAAHPAAAGHQLHHHHRQFRGADLRRFDVRRFQEAGEDVQTIPLHRIGDQGFVQQVFRDYVGLACQGMLVGHCKHGFVGEQRHIGDAGQFQGIGGHHQVQVTPGQRRQRCKGEARGQVQLHFRPGVAELVDGGHQPLEAAMALDGHVQAAGGAAGQAGNVPFGAAQQRQGGIGQLQQAQAGAGEAHRLGLAHEQRHAQAFFKFLELVGEGGLGQVQAFGGFNQAVGFAQGVQGLQVTDFEHQDLHE